jgi:hypothetical protein
MMEEMMERKQKEKWVVVVVVVGEYCCRKRSDGNLEQERRRRQTTAQMWMEKEGRKGGQWSESRRRVANVWLGSNKHSREHRGAALPLFHP